MNPIFLHSLRICSVNLVSCLSKPNSIITQKLKCFNSGLFNFDIVRHAHSQDSEKYIENHEARVNKAHTICRYKRLIKEAARDHGTFLEFNPKLKQIVEESRSIGLSESAVDYSLKITLDNKANVGMYEILFPAKCLITLQYESLDPTNLEKHINNATDPYDAAIMRVSKRHMYYTEKGVVVISAKSDGSPLEAKDSDLLSQTIGSVDSQVDLSGCLLISLFCDPSSIFQLKANVESKGYMVEEAYVGLVPKKIVPIKTVPNVGHLLEELSDIDEIDRIHGNFV